MSVFFLEYSTLLSCTCAHSKLCVVSIKLHSLGVMRGPTALPVCLSEPEGLSVTNESRSLVDALDYLLWWGYHAVASPVESLQTFFKPPGGGACLWLVPGQHTYSTSCLWTGETKCNTHQHLLVSLVSGSVCGQMGVWFWGKLCSVRFFFSQTLCDFKWTMSSRCSNLTGGDGSIIVWIYCTVGIALYCMCP